MTDDRDELDFAGLRAGLVGLVDHVPADELVVRATIRRQHRRAQASVIAAVLAVAVIVPLWFGARHLTSAPPGRIGNSPAVSTSSTGPTPTTGGGSVATNGAGPPATTGSRRTSGVEPTSGTPSPEIGPWGLPAPTTATRTSSSEFDAYGPDAVDLTDATHWFALRRDCSTGSCSTALLATSDGSHWADRKTPVPAVAPADYTGPSLLALGGDRVLIALNGLGYVGPVWFSADAGVSWAAVPSYSSTTVAAAAPGEPLILQCQLEQDLKLCSRKLAVLSPTTGKLSVLSHQPAMTVDAMAAARPLANGSVWVSGTLAGGRPAIAVTRNGGASWQVTPLDAMSSNIFDVVITRSPAGGDLYTTVIGQLPEVKNGLLAIYHSSDGRHWTRTWASGTGAKPLTSVGVPIVDPAGRLILLDEMGGAWVSRDDGRTFDPMTSPGNVAPILTPAGYVLLDGWSFELSADGATWQRHSIPMG